MELVLVVDNQRVSFSHSKCFWEKCFSSLYSWLILRGVFICSQYVYKNRSITAVRDEMVQLVNLLDTVRIKATDNVIVWLSPILTSFNNVLRLLYCISEPFSWWCNEICVAVSVWTLVLQTAEYTDIIDWLEDLWQWEPLQCGWQCWGCVGQVCAVEENRSVTSNQAWRGAAHCVSTPVTSFSNSCFFDYIFQWNVC